MGFVCSSDMSYASMLSFSFMLLTVSEKKNFDFFLGKFTLCVAPQQIKLSDLDKSRMKHEGLLNKHFCKKKFQISQMTWQILSISTFPIISLWKL